MARQIGKLLINQIGGQIGSHIGRQVSILIYRQVSHQICTSRLVNNMIGRQV